jgi:tRNA threonylcarbamoyladenosine biosynthesis protein TsaB
MLILALDTALETCSAALVADGKVLAARAEPMARGHQERLAPLVEALAREAGVAPAEIDRIGVTRGPGSFTGLRVGLAFAKGLGFALGRPVLGVGTLEALAAGTSGVAAAVIDARREQVYVQAFRDGAPLSEPEAVAVDTAIERLAPLRPALLVGPGAGLLASAFPAAALAAPTVDPVALAGLVAAAAETSRPAEPLYLRAPDAKLPADKLPAS